jgi:hypothetical protein
MDNNIRHETSNMTTDLYLTALNDEGIEMKAKLRTNPTDMNIISS